MPVLADAYSDAHLNLDTLDRDITDAIQRVERAAARFEQILQVDVELDTSRAQASLASLNRQVRETRRAIESGEADFRVAADTEGLLADLSAIESLKADLASDVVIAVRLDTDRFIGESALVEATKQQLAGDVSVTQRVVQETTRATADAVPEVAIPEINIDPLAAADDALDDIERERSVQFDIDDLTTLLLNLDQIDVSISVLERTVQLGVDVDTAAAEAELAGLYLQRQTLEQTLSFAADADIDAALAKLAVLQGAKEEIDNPITIPTDIDIGQTLRDAKNQIKRSTRIAESIELDADPTRAQATAASLTAEINAILSRISDIEPNIDDIGVLADAIKLKAELEAILRKVEVKVDVDRGLGSQLSPFRRGFESIASAGLQIAAKTFTESLGLIGEGLNGLSTGVKTVFSGLTSGVGTATDQISEGVGQIAASFQKLQQAGGPILQVVITLASFAGIAVLIGGVVNAIAALISVIIGLIAYVIPLATGLLAAAAGFAAVTLAATGAVGALGLLVFTSEEAQAQIKSLFTSFQTVVEPALAPIRTFLLDEFGPALLGSLSTLVQRLAPFFTDAFGPVLNALLPFIEILGQIGGPIAVAVGQGLGQLANTLNQFFTVLTTNEAALFTISEGIQSFFNVLDALIRIVGEAGFAFAPFLNDILNGFASLTNASIAPFLEIIRTFGNALPALGESFSAILAPVGDLAVVIGRAIAALAPYVDEVFQIIQLLIPGLNFEAITVAIDRLTPAFAGLFERLGPLLTQATDDFVRFTEEVLSPATVNALVGGVETAVTVLASVFKFLADNAGLIEAVITGSVAGFQTLLIIIGALIIQLQLLPTVFSILLSEIADIFSSILNFIADILDKIPAAFRGILGGVNPDDFRRIGDGLARTFQTVQDFNSGQIEFAWGLITSGVDGLQTSFGGLDDATTSSKQNLDEYKVTVETVAGALTLVGPAARAAEEALKGVNERFPATIKLLDQASDAFTAGNIFKKAREDQKKLADQQRQAAEDAARLAQENVRRTFSGGRLSEFFQEQAAEVDEGVRDVGEAARAAARAALGLGQLRDFLRNDSVELDRAFNELVGNLRLRAQNLQRIAAISALGYRDLALQLATLSSDPEFLQRFLDELQERGTGALADFNGQIVAARQTLEGSIASVDPGLAEAAGFGAAPETEKAVKKQGVTVFQALDRLNADIRKRIRNAQRIGQLQQAGFSPLAVQLTSLAGDPAELEQSLDELFAAGSGAIAAANARFAASNEALAATAAQLDPALAEALGLEQTKAQVEEDKFDIFKALDTFQKEQQLRIDNIRNIGRLEQLAPDVALGLVEAFGDDQEALNEVLTSFFNAPIEQQTLFLAGWEQKSAEAEAELAKLDPRLAAVVTAAAQNNQLGSSLSTYLQDSVSQFPQQFQEQFAQSITNGQFAAQFGAGFFGPAGGGNPADELIIDEANRLGSLYVTTLTDSLGTQVPTAFRAAIDGAIVGQRQFFGFLEPQSPLTISPQATSALASYGAQIGGLLALGVQASATSQVTAALTTAVIAAGTAVTESAAVVLLLAGIGSGEAFATGVTVGYAISSGAISTTVAASFATLASQLTVIAGAVGRDAGTVLANTLIGALNSPDVLQRLRTAMFFFIAEASLATQNAGPNIGRDFINGIKAGVDETAPALLQTVQDIALLLRTTLEQALDINSPSGVGMTIGNQFIAGITAGIVESTGQLTTVAGRVRTALEQSLAQPVAIDTAVAGVAPVGVGVAAPAAAALTGPAGAPSDTVLLQQMLIALQAQNAELRAVAARPLIGEYNVTTNKEPQSPDQLAQDAAFARALLL